MFTLRQCAVFSGCPLSKHGMHVGTSNPKYCIVLVPMSITKQLGNLRPDLPLYTVNPCDIHFVHQLFRSVEHLGQADHDMQISWSAPFWTRSLGTMTLWISPGDKVLDSPNLHTFHVIVPDWKCIVWMPWPFKAHLSDATDVMIDKVAHHLDKGNNWKMNKSMPWVAGACRVRACIHSTCLHQSMLLPSETSFTVVL